MACTSPEALSTGIVTVIKAVELDLRLGLEDMYDNMSIETVKAMRRLMPITRTKMNWNINEASLNLNLQK